MEKHNTPDVAVAHGFDKGTPARVIGQVSEKVVRATETVRRYPAQSLAIAALAGFFVARTLGRRANQG